MTGTLPPILDIRGLRKSFGAVEVLRGIDLAVLPQELVFVIGPSGSGKSTLLRCCNRLEEPTSGSIQIDGVDLLARATDINRMRQKIGILGTNISAATSVTFNGTSAAFNVVSPSFLEATVPAGATSGVIQVQVPTGTLSSNIAFIVQ